MFEFKVVITIFSLSLFTNFDVLAVSEKQLVNAIQDFATNFFSNLFNDPVNENKNIAFSPFSISQILTIIIPYAGDQTQIELMNVLGYRDRFSSAKKLDKTYGFLLDQYDENVLNKRGIELSLVSFFLIHYSVNFENHKFKDNAGHNYKINVWETDFSNAWEVIDGINKFVELRTHHLIPRILNELDFDKDSLLALINAFYFKGNWENKFSIMKNEKFEFKNFDGTTSLIEMMFSKSFFKYTEDDQVQYVQIPYLGNVTLSILLPKKNILINSIKNKERYRLKLKESSDFSKVQLILPKFKVDFKFSMIGPLEGMGMLHLFVPEANLTGIAEGDVFMNTAIHESFLDFNEAATEGSASSVPKYQMISDDYTPFMNINRPFFFDIYDELNDLHLFSGSIKKL